MKKPANQNILLSILDYSRKIINNATVTLKPLAKTEERTIYFKFDPRTRLYRAEQITPGAYFLKVEAPDYEPDERKISVGATPLRETFILGKKGMPFYYRGKVKVPFEPIPDLLALSLKPGMTKKEEENLISHAAVFKLIPQEAEKSILQNNVRIFKFPANTSEADRQKIQDRISENRSVKIAGPVLHREKNTITFLTNQLIIKFKIKIKETEIYKIAKQYGLTIIRSIPYSANAYLMAAPKANYNILKICDEIVRTGLVEYAEPNLVNTPVLDYTPNDFLLASQPHHPIINTEDAWDITMGDNDIIIAVVDSGCDIDHPDFTNDAALGWTKVYSPYDFTGMDADPTSETHGTKSCGIATANADNTEGVAGVAPGCRLMPIKRPSGEDIKFADAYVWIAGFNPGWVADGTNYPVGTVFPAVPAPGADVISSSYGFWDASLSGIMKDAFDFITTFGRNGRGCVVVFSVGNDNLDFTTYRYWAAYEKTIAVAASAIAPPDAAEVKISTSNFGSLVDVCAPGGGQAGGAESRTLSTTNVGSGDTAGSAGAASNDYDDFGQTSCACPQVSGIAALMLSANPDLTWVQVRQILRDTAIKIDAANVDPTGQWVDNNGDGNIDFSQWYGFGRVNAQAAVQAAQDLVGIDPLTGRDTWIKENSIDIGDVPCPPPYSPDVWVRNTDPALDNPAEIDTHQSPIRGQDNWVYANIRNRGAVDSLDVYVRISITRWAGTQYVYPDDFIPTGAPSTYPPATMAPGTYLIGEAHIASIPAGDFVTINMLWPAALIPPAEVIIDGVTYSWADSCLLVEISPHDGPTPTGNHTWENNNLCQRNITIIDAADNDDAAVAFVAGNQINDADLVHIRIDRKKLPAGVKLFFDYIDIRTAKEVEKLINKTKEKTILRPATKFPYRNFYRKDQNINYQIKPVSKGKRLIFELPTIQKARVPLIKKQREYKIVALLAKGLKNLKKGDYKIDIYQENAQGNLEGGINLIIRKK